MRHLLALGALAAIAACSTTTGLDAQSSRSGFDGARRVSIIPHGNACTRMLCTGLGAQWTEAAPGGALLIVRVSNEYLAILGAELMIDGQRHSLKAVEGSTEFSAPGSVMRESTRGFSTSLDIVRAITASRKTWLRVRTPHGYIEDAVVDGDTDSKAFHALKRFLSEVGNS